MLKVLSIEPLSRMEGFIDGEDKKEITDGISHILEKVGHKVDCVYDEGWIILRSFRWLRTFIIKPEL